MLTVEILKNFTPLHTLANEQLARLASRVVVLEVAKGAQVCAEGDTDNDSIYLLEGGVEMRSNSSSMSRVLQARTPDAAFPVAPGRPRPYTVTATTLARIFRIDNAKLDRAVLLDEVSTTITRVHDSGSAFAGDSAWLEEMLASPAFGSMARERVAMLMLKLVPMIIKAGETVVHQGDAGDCYYIVKAGDLTVSRKNAQGQLELVNKLKRGDVFGEEALLSGNPRNANIVAVCDSIVMRLAKADFEALLKKPLLTFVSVEEAQERRRRGAGLVDVRSAAEFKQGAIKGSLNIPISELRARLTQLDPVCTYILYCNNGVQSEVAAFLLRQRGFEVFVLRGGLESLKRK